MKTLVTIATYEQPDTAYFLKEKLEDEQIDCYFVLLGRVEDRTNIIKLQVDAGDVQKAIKVMMEIREEYGKPIEEIEPGRFVRKILVPTDFSRGSEDACYYALHLARQMEAEIKLLHVFSNPAGDHKMQTNATFETYIQQVTREQEERAKQDMIIFTGRIKRYMSEKNIKNVFVHSAVAMGNILPTLKDVCQTYHPDLIVLGTQGEEEGEKSVFTGVTRELVNGLGIPVFAIPGACVLKEPLKMNILYATDFNENDHTSLNRLLKIMEPFDKAITCIHIDTAHNPAKEERMDELNVFLVNEYGNEKIECKLIDYSDVYQGIRDYVESSIVNLLSFTIHKRGIFDILFMPNLFKKILQEASIPILIFPS